MTHGTKIENFIGLDIGNNCDKIGGVTQISVVKEQFYTRLVTVAVDVINTTCVER